MIICPNCKATLENLSAFCPFCGVSLTSQNSQEENTARSKQNIVIACILTAIVCTVIFVAIGPREDKDAADESAPGYVSAYDNNSDWSSYYDYEYSMDSSYDYGWDSSSNSFSDDSSTIFSNLEITNFSASPGSHGGRMSCKVTNNNPVMSTGYISVNFYDYSEGLLYTQLISVPDVASGESVVCSTLIPKDAFNVQYDYVEFSQGNFSVVD